jgi:UDP-2,3-diacylglucosamine pyrophosphatase LpxH
MSSHNLLAFSDVHLGSELVQYAQPGAPKRGAASQRRDLELAALLDWYRERPVGGKPWRLIIAGDFIDFVGMAVAPNPNEIQTEPTEEERQHGLGSAVDHTVAKLRRVAENHHEVFVALARFVGAGNALVVVRGNHDVDLHWPAVQDEFRAVLDAEVPGTGAHVEFSDWFYYDQGVYIEHGHQYDDYCSYDHVLCPVKPSDPRRSERSLSDILLRYVVRPTRGMLETGHDDAGAIDYLRFGLQLGARGAIVLLQRFFIAVGALFKLWREHFSEATEWVRREHERKIAMLAEARQISLVKLKALASLQRPPVTRSLTKLIAGVMLDRVALGVIGFGMLVWLLIARWTPTLGLEACAGLAVLGPAAWLWRRARGAIDASASLREHAGRVAALLPAALVVMGHTHLPEVQRASDGTATYVNLGGWADDGSAPDDAAASRASRTHLVVQQAGGHTVATLMRWNSEQGPKSCFPDVEFDGGPEG